MTEHAKKRSAGLNILGLVSGILALMSFLAFYLNGEDTGNYYFLGMFFTSLNVSVLCLCFGQVYELLKQILMEMEKKA